MESSNPVAELRDYTPEGLALIFEAPQRYGKTLSDVLFALDAYQTGRTVFSNIQLGFPHEPLKFDEVKLEDGSSKFHNSYVLIDELNFYFDSRKSISGPNVEHGAFILQQKKQGCTIGGTTHGLEMLDVRLRMNYDFLIQPQVFPRYPAKPRILQMKIRNGPLQPHFRRTLTIGCEPFLGLYDSFAVYDPFKESRKKKKEKEEPWETKPSRVKLSF